MAVLSHEFATPICTAKWDEAGQFNPMITTLVLAEVERANLHPALTRSQEVRIGSETEDAGSGEVEPAERKVKQETTGDFHLRNKDARPLFVWCLETFSWMLEELHPGTMPPKTIPVIRNCWASVYRGSDYHQPHFHPMTAFAAVYCLQMPDVAVPQGTLDLLDPRPNINYYNPLVPTFAADTKRILLAPGDLVIFPGWLRHFVNPFRGEGVRITVSLNLDFARISVARRSDRQDD